MPPRRRKAQEPEINLADAFGVIAKGLQEQAIKPNILGYEPHEKQKFFHSAETKRRLYIGGNRSGKTWGSVVEDIWWCTNTHPYLETPPPPVRGRVVGVALKEGIEDIILPIFKTLCAPSTLRGGSWESAYDVGKRKLNFKNGSFIEFMSYEQDLEKFAGTSRHFVHYDEEPPKSVFDECNARLVDTNGRWWISMTPVEGMTWLYDKIYDPADNHDKKDTLFEGDELRGPVWKVVDLPEWNITVVEVAMNENPHLSEEAIAEYLSSLDEDDRLARSRGKFVQSAGKVFKTFQVETHVTHTDIDPAALQKQGWQIYTSTDHGWNNPTAWLWHAVAPEPDGRVITFAEHYKSEMTIEEHVHKVNAMETGWGLDREAILRTGDPAMNQHNAATGTTYIYEYAKRGLFISTETVPKDPTIGIGRMQMYFRLRSDGRPQWTISDSCPFFIKELRNLRFKTRASKKLQYENNPFEEVHKKDDHAFDSAKYFATWLPELAPDAVPLTMDENNMQGGILSYAVAMLAASKAEESAGNDWTIVESYN